MYPVEDKELMIRLRRELRLSDYDDDYIVEIKSIGANTDLHPSEKNSINGESRLDGFKFSINYSALFNCSGTDCSD